MAPAFHAGAQLHQGSTMRNNEENAARLEDLMTMPPMTPQQHAEIMRKRIVGRHALEEARDRRFLGLDDELFPG
jgi:hypothetical protein